MRRWTDAQLISAIGKSFTVSNVLRELGLTVKPGNFRTIRKYVALLQLDTSHFTGKAHGTAPRPSKMSLAEILVENSGYTSSKLKRRLVKEGVLPDLCAECRQEPVWNSKPLVLQLDHINGNPTDNRLTNLRILCPHCHTQTPTFTNKRRVP